MASCDVLFVIDSTGSMKNSIQAAHDNVVDIAAQLQNEHPKTLFNYGCICYRDNFKDKNDENERFDFDPIIENLEIFLDDIEAKGGGGDGPEDWVSALNDAFNLHWSADKKVIIWIADYPAHDKQFGGNDKCPGEAEKLIDLVKKLAHDEYYFTGISIKDYAGHSFQKMKQIYDENGGKRFTIEKFNRNNTPDDIAITLTQTTVRTISGIYFTSSSE